LLKDGLVTVDNIQLVYSDYKMDTQMTVQDYLLKFRKISSLESLEKLFDHLNYSLTDTEEIVNMYRAADHRRAELVSAVNCSMSGRCLNPSGVTCNKDCHHSRQLLILPLFILIESGRNHVFSLCRTYRRMAAGTAGMAAGCAA
jgi:hypothetical protein